MVKTKPKILDKHYSAIECIHWYNLDIENRVIYLTSESMDNILGEGGVDYQMWVRFIKNLDILNSNATTPITIKSSNIGGCWYYGMAIYDAIKHSKSPVEFYIESCACSMGSIIPQSAKTRYISKYADFLIHLGSESLSGEFKSIQSTLKHLETKTDIMFDIYAERCVNGQFFKGKKYSVTDTAKYLAEQVDKKAEWWLSSDEALKYGFVDQIY